MNGHQDIEKLFADNLGSSFEVKGSSSWEQLQARRQGKRSLNPAKKALYASITITTCVAVAAMFVPPELLLMGFYKPETKKQELHINQKQGDIPPVMPQKKETESSYSSPTKEEKRQKAVVQETYKKETTPEGVKPSAEPADSQATTREQSPSGIYKQTSTLPSGESELDEHTDTVSPQTKTPSITKKVITVHKSQVLVEDTVVKKVKKRRKKN